MKITKTRKLVATNNGTVLNTSVPKPFVELLKLKKGDKINLTLDTTTEVITITTHTP